MRTFGGRFSRHDPQEQPKLIEIDTKNAKIPLNLTQTKENKF